MRKARRLAGCTWPWSSGKSLLSTSQERRVPVGLGALIFELSWPSQNVHWGGGESVQVSHLAGVDTGSVGTQPYSWLAAGSHSDW